MIGEYADKIFRIKEVLCGYVVYVAKYRHPKGRTTRWRESTRRTSLCGVINYIIEKVGMGRKEYNEVDILKGWVCAESREKYLKDIYEKD